LWATPQTCRCCGAGSSSAWTSRECSGARVAAVGASRSVARIARSSACSVPRHASHHNTPPPLLHTRTHAHAHAHARAHTHTHTHTRTHTRPTTRAHAPRAACPSRACWCRRTSATATRPTLCCRASCSRRAASPT
jgi:hypothetical protein